MQCLFVSKDYLLAVSSTAVDRHGQPFRDSKNAISYVSSGPRPSCPPCGGVSPEHHREGGSRVSVDAKIQNRNFRFPILHVFTIVEYMKNLKSSAYFCRTDYSILDKILKLFSETS